MSYLAQEHHGKFMSLLDIIFTIDIHEGVRNSSAEGTSRSGHRFEIGQCRSLDSKGIEPS